ncbi:hypothetical protein BJY52DRAFT_1228549 [Lactarius psammicola]|nr:hypothetical protein BJY52DRAFT_1228549 [Lactarius psammicola]
MTTLVQTTIMCVDSALEPPILFDIIPKTESSLNLLRTLSLAANPYTPTSPTQSQVNVRVAAPPPSHLDASIDYRHSTKLRATLVWIGNTGEWSDSVFYKVDVGEQDLLTSLGLTRSIESSAETCVAISKSSTSTCATRRAPTAYRGASAKLEHYGLTCPWSTVCPLRNFKPRCLTSSSSLPIYSINLPGWPLAPLHRRFAPGASPRHDWWPSSSGDGNMYQYRDSQAFLAEALLMPTVGGCNGDLEQQRVSLFSSLAHLSQHGDIPVPQPYHTMLTKEWHVPLPPLPRDYYLRMPHDAVL